MAEKPIGVVLQEYADWLLSIAGVVGTGQGQAVGRPCITVFVAEKSASLLAQIPGEIEGYPVSIEETGEFRAYPSP